MQDTLATACRIDQSVELFQRAQRVIPGGVNSPVRAFRAVGGTPRFIASAKDAYLFDVDGNQYIDYVGSWGPMLLGHANPQVIEAVKKAAEKGLSYGAPSPDEVALAELIVSRFDSIEKVRMVNSGTESTMTAIRLARGVTGRDKMIKFEGCYHGHADHLLVKAGSGTITFGAPSSPGVPKDTAKDTLVASYNDLDSVNQLFEKYGEQIACVIIEPIAGNVNLLLPKPGFLKGLREICNHYGALLIFDEVITGFRVGYQGVQSLWDIRPDITTLGKIVGGGMPVGAIGARADIMDQLSPMGKIYQAGTLSGNPLAMAAGLAMLRQLTPDIYATLAQKTKKLAEGLQLITKSAGVSLQVNHCTGMFGIFFTEADRVEKYEDVMACDVNRFTQFFNQMLTQGIYLAPSAFEIGFMSLAHTDADIERTLQAAEVALAIPVANDI